MAPEGKAQVQVPDLGQDRDLALVQKEGLKARVQEVAQARAMEVQAAQAMNLALKEDLKTPDQAQEEKVAQALGQVQVPRDQALALVAQDLDLALKGDLVQVQVRAQALGLREDLAVQDLEDKDKVRARAPVQEAQVPAQVPDRDLAQGPVQDQALEERVRARAQAPSLAQKGNLVILDLGLARDQDPALNLMEDPVVQDLDLALKEEPALVAQDPGPDPDPVLTTNLEDRAQAQEAQAQVLAQDLDQDQDLAQEKAAQAPVPALVLALTTNLEDKARRARALALVLKESQDLVQA